MKELADISALQAFVAVADAKSFDGGARRLGLTRSAAGKAVARLEALLGARLLHRTTRRVGLTAEGQLFRDQAIQILADLEHAQQELQRARAAPRGTLRLTATEAFGRQVVLPILVEFLNAWPDLAAEANFTDRVVDLVEDGYDIAVRFGTSPTSSDLISRVVARSVAQLCASPTYLARHSLIETIADLSAHRHLIAGTRDRSHAWTLCKNADPPVVVQPRPILLTDSASAISDAAIAGLGIAYLPRFLIEPEIARGRLTCVLPSYCSPEFPICVLYPTRQHLSPKVRLFIELLEQRLDFP